MKKKLILFSLVASLLATSIPVYAANSTSEAGTIQSQVISQVASSWVVTVPATINVGATQTANYEVTVKGDVADDTSVSVIPDATITLTDGKSSATANIEQDKQQWLGSEVTSEGLSTTGTITINSALTAGTWSGNLNFLVNCTEDLGDLLAKVEMMKDIDLYVLGDSILDGVVGQNIQYYGFAEATNNLYGTNSYKSYAVSGAYLTTFNPALPNIVQQATALTVRIGNSDRYTNNTAIVFDGGGNDFIYLNEHPDDAEIDLSAIGNAFYGVLSHLNSLEDADGDKYTTPIIFVIPKTTTLDSDFDKLKGAAISAQSTYPNLIIVDCRDFLEDSDLSDDVHMNVSGQTKLTHKIVDELYDFYN